MKDDLRDEPFAKMPEQKPKVRPPRPGTRAFVEYLRALPESPKVGELDGPIVPFGSVPRR